MAQAHSGFHPRGLFIRVLTILACASSMVTARDRQEVVIRDMRRCVPVETVDSDSLEMIMIKDFSTCEPQIFVSRRALTPGVWILKSRSRGSCSVRHTDNSSSVGRLQAERHESQRLV